MTRIKKLKLDEWDKDLREMTAADSGTALEQGIMRMWAHTPDPNFLANPDRGSPHSRGVAIDLTLVETATGKILDMGTSFDAFTPLSFHGNLEVSKKAQENRYRLLGLMTAAGWDCYLNEWWHYQLFDSTSYEVLSDKILETSMMD